MHRAKHHTHGATADAFLHAIRPERERIGGSCGHAVALKRREATVVNECGERFLSREQLRKLRTEPRGKIADGIAIDEIVFDEFANDGVRNPPQESRT